MRKSPIGLLQKVGKIHADAGVTADGGPIEVVELFKYSGSLKSADGICKNAIISQIGIVKEMILDLASTDRETEE